MGKGKALCMCISAHLGVWRGKKGKSALTLSHSIMGWRHPANKISPVRQGDLPSPAAGDMVHPGKEMATTICVSVNSDLNYCDFRYTTLGF